MTEDFGSRIDFDDGGVPVAASYDPYGNYALVVMEGSRITDLSNRVTDSLVGRNVRIFRQPVKPSAYRFMLGDNSEIGIRW